MPKSANGFPVQVPVKFSGQSSNKESASIGLSISREHADVSQVEEFFCAKRLSAELTLGDKNGTKPLPGMQDNVETIDGVIDAKSYIGRAREFATRLIGSKEQAAKLVKFAGRNGTLTITDVEVIAEEKDDKPAKETGRGADTASPAGKGHGDPIEALGLSASLTDKLRATDLKTVGDLIKFINADEWWHRKIKGVGKKNVDTITDALASWYAKTSSESAGESNDAGDASAATDGPKIHEPSSDVPPSPDDLPVSDLANYGVPARKCVMLAAQTESKTMGDLFAWLETGKVSNLTNFTPNDVLRVTEALDAWEEKHPAPAAM